MPKLPVLKPHEVVSRLEATIVPFHKGRDVSPVILRKIVRDIGMSADDFVAVKG
jgi:predicted RNA binding protein YcfA (HicA-like mRNA interferase family)